MPNQLLDNLNAIRRHLLKPLDDAPNLDVMLGAMIDETMHLENELGNSSVAWNIRDFRLRPLNNNFDCRVSDEDVGKILMVTIDGDALPVEFTDLRDASSDWWNWSPQAVDRLEDFGYYDIRDGRAKIAFYRKDGVTFARFPNIYDGQQMTVKTQGVFDRDTSLSSAAALPSYHQLINVRAAQNVLPGAMWSTDAPRDEAMRRNLMMSLPRQETRYYEQFVIAKRSLTADEAVFIGTDEEYF